jgi:predicted ATP-grasp superfamily ATP-dependent carboligase
MRVFIATDSTANDRKGLAAVRAFGRRGDHVTVGSDSFIAEPFLSRYCNARVRYPCPATDQGGFIKALVEHLERNAYDAFLPVSDYTTIAAVQYQEALARHVPLAVPPRGARRVAADKLATLRLADSLGIQGPVTYAPTHLDDVVEISKTFSYPCILKLRGSAGSVGMSVPRSPEELIRAFQDLPTGGDDLYDYRPLIQEFVPGYVHDVCVLFDRGEPRAVLTQQRTRTWRPDGGMGLVDTTTHEPELAELGIELFRALRWHGPGQAEFKIDARDGTPRLMEINPRFWGTVDLAVQAGVDFPVLTAQLAKDGHVDPVFEYEVGRRYRWPFPNGVKHLLYAPDRLLGFPVVRPPRIPVPAGASVFRRAEAIGS